MSGTRTIFDAIQFHQGVGQRAEGQVMYLLSAPARWLTRRAKVDRWREEVDEDNWREKGYQREPSESHLRAIERYLRGTLRHATTKRVRPVFPTSVLLAARTPLRFEPRDDANGDPWVKPGKLVIPEDQDLFVVDGQHRIEGLKRIIESAEPGERGFADYHLPVTVMLCKDIIDEMIHFVTINKQQKSVRTDLAERLLDVVREKDPSLISDDKLRQAADERKLRLMITKQLERRHGQPWYGRIALPSERRKGMKVASEGQVSKSLRHLCDDPPAGWPPEKLVEFVVDFWCAIQELIPEAFEDPRQYTIQRTPGFASLHQLLSGLAPSYRGKDSLRDLLQGVDPYFTDPQYWVRGGDTSQYTSEGAFRLHARLIREAINEKLRNG